MIHNATDINKELENKKKGPDTMEPTIPQTEEPQQHIPNKFFNFLEDEAANMSMDVSSTTSQKEFTPNNTIEVLDDFEVEKNEPQQKETIMPLQEGMFAGAEMINEYMKYHPYQAKETNAYVYQVIKKTKTNPSKELIEAYYSMVFNDTFGTAEYVEKEAKLSTMEKMNVFKCRNKLRNETWKEAFIIHNDIQYMNTLTGAKSILRKITGRK